MNQIKKKVNDFMGNSDHQSDKDDFDIAVKTENTLSNMSLSGKKPFVVREPSKGLSLRLKELLEFHELIYFLTWRDLKVRYKQTALGMTWAVLQPFLTMVVFSLFSSAQP